jgi:allophanate hydrolase subunit 2
MADHQPTGGYAKIAVVIEPDLPLLAQAWPGDLVRFIPVGAVPAGVVLRLNLAGRSHLVSVESTPPRYGT